jgi:hypothetical protein
MPRYLGALGLGFLPPQLPLPQPPPAKRPLVETEAERDEPAKSRPKAKQEEASDLTSIFFMRILHKG